MRTNLTLKRCVFLAGFLVLLLCFYNICYAVVLDKDEETGEDMPGMPPLHGPGQRPDAHEDALGKEPKQPGYAPGEVIVKLKDKEPKDALYAQSYAVRAQENKNVLDTLKSKYSLKDEKPVFKGLHEKLKKKNLSQATLEEETARSGALNTQRRTSAEPSEKVDLLPIYILKTDEDVLKTCAKLKQDPDVEYAEPNYKMEIQMVPNDPYYSSSGSWGQPYDDLWGIKKLQCEQAWDITQGEGAVVAVIDTGVDYNHEDIAQNIWLNEDEIPDNGIDDDNNGYVDDIKGYDFVNNDKDPMDDHGHGTHVSGTIAGIGNNNLGVIGVAPKAKIMAVKGFDTSGSGEISKLANCVIYAADRSAQVLSNSWGGFGTSEVLIDAFHYAHSRGCVAVAAAGNYNIDTAQFEPANIDTVIAVAATNQNDKKCSFSNYGDDVDVGAPGGDSTSGDGDNYWGRNILSLRSDNNGNPTDMYEGGISIVGSKYYRARGTSMACPHAAGVAALIMSAHPGLTNEEVRVRLIAETDPYPQEPIEPLGSGRINAYKAITGVPHSYFKIRDVRLRELNGNGNTIPESNEEVELIVSIENLWTGAVTVSATLSTEDPLIQSISKPQTVFGGISQGEIKDNAADPFIINIGDIIHYGAIAKFTLTIQADGIVQTIKFPTTLGIHKISDVNPYTEFFNPDISGLADDQGRISHNIVWNEKPSDGGVRWDIFVYNLESGDKQKIGQANYLAYPTILENKVAWAANYLNEGYGAEVFLYDLQTHEGNLIPTTHSSQIYGHAYYRPIALTKYGLSWINIFDWFSETPSPILFYNFDTNEIYEIGRYKTGYTMPDSSGDKIVWALYDNNSATSDVFLFDPLTRETRQITYNDKCFAPSISGDKIVWGAPGGSGGSNIELYDITTDERRIIKSFNIYHRPGFVDIYGDKIVYEAHSVNSEHTWDSFLYLHDLTTNRTIQIDKHRRPLSWSPATISNNIVVWQYDFNIYVADVNATTFPSCPPVFDIVQDITSREGYRIEFPVYATDANGDNLTYSVSNLPQGAEFWAHGGLPSFQWIPNFFHVGKTYHITFSVTDGEFITDMPVSITITDGPPLVGTLTSLRDSPDPFTPYGEPVSITAVFKEKSDWMLDIVSGDGATVKSFSDLVNATTKVSVSWDGLDSSGNIVPDGSYDYALLGFDFESTYGYGYGHGTITVDTTPPAISNVTVSLDPFQPNMGLLTSISFDISEPSYVSVSVYDRNLLINKFMTTLTNNIVKWNGKDKSGNYVLPGPYNYVIEVIDKAGNGNSYIGTIMVEYSASEILSLRASPDPFSPNGDGTYDTTRISGGFNQIVSWILEIKNTTGEVARTFSGMGRSASATWDGRGISGTFLPDGTYTYVLTGTNPAGNSATQQGTVTLKANAPPAPSNLTAQAVFSTQVKLIWQDNSSDETGFKVEISNDGITFTNKGSLAPNATTFTTSGLIANTMYYFRVYAYNVAGKAYSNMVSCATLPPPIAPSNLTATPLSSTKIKLSWQDNSTDETGFRVEMSTDGVTYVAKGSAKTDITTRTISKLTPNTTYYFRVYAYRGSDKSGYSEVVSGTTLPLPAAPSNLTATVLSSTQIKLSWQDNSLDETGFKIEQSLDGITFTYKGYVTADKTAYTVSGLITGTTYYFRVYAYRGADKSEYSDVVTIILATTP